MGGTVLTLCSQLISPLVTSLLTITCHSILGLTMMWTMWTYGSTPVLELPPEWTYPLTWFISLPTGVSGGVGLPLWMGLNSAFIKSLPKFSLFPVNTEYSQLPLD